MKKQYITKNTLIGEIVDRYPKLAEVLAVDYGFHCIGCSASGAESLAQGAMVHGMKTGEIGKLVIRLNQLIDEELD